MDGSNPLVQTQTKSLSVETVARTFDSARLQLAWYRTSATRAALQEMLADVDVALIAPWHKPRGVECGVDIAIRPDGDAPDVVCVCI